MTNEETTSEDAGLEPWAGLLRSETTWAAPPADLVDRIGAELGFVPAADASAVVTPLARPPRRRRWLGWPAIAAAAAIALVFCIGLLVGGAGDDSGEAAEPADVPPVAHLTLTGTDRAPAAKAEVDVFDRGAGYALILDTSGLEPAPDGSFYQGWLRSEAGDEVSIGTFHMRGGDATVVLWSGVSIDLYPTLVVTLTTALAAPTDSAVVMMGALTSA